MMTVIRVHELLAALGASGKSGANMREFCDGVRVFDGKEKRKDRGGGRGKGVRGFR